MTNMKLTSKIKKLSTSLDIKELYAKVPVRYQYTVHG